MGCDTKREGGDERSPSQVVRTQHLWDHPVVCKTRIARKATHDENYFVREAANNALAKIEAVWTPIRRKRFGPFPGAAYSFPLVGAGGLVMLTRCPTVCFAWRGCRCGDRRPIGRGGAPALGGIVAAPESRQSGSGGSGAGEAGIHVRHTCLVRNLVWRSGLSASGCGGMAGRIVCGLLISAAISLRTTRVAVLPIPSETLLFALEFHRLLLQSHSDPS